MPARSPYPKAVDPSRVGTYPATAFAGGGYVWDEVLEYRVWCHPAEGGTDYFYAYATYAEALARSKQEPGAEEPLALIRQREYIDEPTPGNYRHVRKVRIAEWPVVFLRRPRRTRQTIPAFLAPDAPPNRLDIIRGLAKRPVAKPKSARRARTTASRARPKGRTTKSPASKPRRRR